MFFHTPLKGRAGLYILSGLGVLLLVLSGAIAYLSQAFQYARWDIFPELWIYI